ncbi:dephospho-CoA kinase [Cyanobacterium aponinum AL20118]|uniref:Dephospho-CoA kinase n=1 Tax=Cyanobacterium aponinum AL20115 TaxID=3090662 RepID=A0AAF0ZBV7_9CHRO|nr:dephospho-CoA kinase [Cyanobacterium aponinum]WPF87448.1 dephospho-CoA kinase [Cyanobacterium aponinum AL20115]
MKGNNIKSKIIGLTGGIATGKSTVSNYLRDKYYISVFDADIFARDAVKVDSPIFVSIIERYGSDILLDNNTLNRSKLGTIIFNDIREKEWLESQIHPFVYNCFRSLIPTLIEEINIFTIPLLFEANMTDLVSEIWVVTCDYEQQLTRLQSRNNLSKKDAIARINSQMSLTEKVQLADVVIDNNGNLTQLIAQIDGIMSSYFHKN